MCESSDFEGLYTSDLEMAERSSVQFLQLLGSPAERRLLSFD